MRHPKTGKLLAAGTTRAEERRIAEGAMLGRGIDKTLPGKPTRRCSACGKMFQQTVRRRRLCGDCFRRASGDPESYSVS